MDVPKLEKILSLLAGTDVTSLEWRNGEETLTIERGGRPPAAPLQAVAPTATAPATVAAPRPVEARSDLHTVTSPFVGTFYRAASPEAPAFADIGQTVRKGQVLCIVEAMKLMNEIEAEMPGKIVEILVQNGQSVEFGEPLFRLEPA